MAALGYVLSNVTASADGAVVAVHAIYIPMLLPVRSVYPGRGAAQGSAGRGRAIPLTYFVAPFRSVMVDGAGLGPSLETC